MSHSQDCDQVVPGARGQHQSHKVAWEFPNLYLIEKVWTWMNKPLGDQNITSVPMLEEVIIKALGGDGGILVFGGPGQLYAQESGQCV